MNSRTTLNLIFGIVIVCMLAVTTWASTYEGVFIGARKILSEPWGIATFADTYFAFLTFYCWVFYKESSWASKLAWLVLILTLGNIAMAAYILWQVYKLPSGQPSHLILLRKPSWCTTKNIENLKNHLSLYQIYNNDYVLS